MQEKYQFTVNGRQCHDENKPLLRFLRDDLHCIQSRRLQEGACTTIALIEYGQILCPDDTEGRRT